MTNRVFIPIGTPFSDFNVGQIMYITSVNRLTGEVQFSWDNPYTEVANSTNTDHKFIMSDNSGKLPKLFCNHNWKTYDSGFSAPHDYCEHCNELYKARVK